VCAADQPASLTNQLINPRLKMAQKSTSKSVSFGTLPALGAPLENGVFAGVITSKDGIHDAVILLPENGINLTWKKAITWAKKQGGELPTRPIAALLFSNVKASLPSGWHWTSEEEDASYAWVCYFDYGDQYGYHESYEGGAVAVRMIPITA
jgi:hypothetical protein